MQRKSYLFLSVFWNNIFWISSKLLKLTDHLFNQCKYLLSHFCEAFSVIARKSFQSSGSLEEITDVKLSGINMLYSPFLFKLLLNMLQWTNKQFIWTRISFRKFLPSVWVTNSFISHPFTDPCWRACVSATPVMMTPCSHCPQPFLPLLSRKPPTACSSRPPAGSLHCPEAMELSWP